VVARHSVEEVSPKVGVPKSKSGIFPGVSRVSATGKPGLSPYSTYNLAHRGGGRGALLSHYQVSTLVSKSSSVSQL
jgi:hypothetical protein